MSGRARRATRPTSCLFGAAGASPTATACAGAPAALPSNSLVRAVRESPEVGRRCQQVRMILTGGTCIRRKAAPTRATPQQSTPERNHPQWTKFSTVRCMKAARSWAIERNAFQLSKFDFCGFRVLAPSSLRWTHTAPGNGSTKPLKLDALFYGSVEPYFIRRARLFLRRTAPRFLLQFLSMVSCPYDQYFETSDRQGRNAAGGSAAEDR